MNLENIAEKIKGGARALGFGAALFFGAAGLASAQEIDFSKKYFFECNYWADTHGDDCVYSWDQFHGIKNDFKDNEEIIFIGHDPGWKKGDTVEWILYGPNGKIVEKESSTFLEDANWYRAGGEMYQGEPIRELMRDIRTRRNGGCGNYKVEWYTNGKKEDLDNHPESKFTVSPSE